MDSSSRIQSVNRVEMLDYMESDVGSQALVASAHSLRPGLEMDTLKTLFFYREGERLLRNKTLEDARSRKSARRK